MTKRDYTNHIAAFLDKRGAAYRFEHGSKHPRVVVTHHGRTFKVSFPASSRNRNFHHVVVLLLRRLLDQAAA